MTAHPKPSVTQADRNLAADILELQERRELADFVRAGERDSSNTVQVIARHRQSAEAASRAEVTRLNRLIAANASMQEADHKIAQSLIAAEAASRAREERLREALVMAVAEMMRASGRLDMIAMCNEDRRIAAALSGACDFARAALSASDGEG